MPPPPDSDDWREWRSRVDSRFKRLDEKIDSRHEITCEHRRDVLAKLEGLRALVKPDHRDLQRYGDDHDEDEISASTNIEDVKRKARRQRTKAREGEKMKKWGKFVAPFLIGAGAVIWETIKRVVMK